MAILITGCEWFAPREPGIGAPVSWSNLPGWERVLIAVGVAAAALLWFDSIELKTAE